MAEPIVEPILLTFRSMATYAAEVPLTILLPPSPPPPLMLPAPAPAPAPVPVQLQPPLQLQLQLALPLPLPLLLVLVMPPLAPGPLLLLPSPLTGCICPPSPPLPGCD